MARNVSNTTLEEHIVTAEDMPLTEQRDFANSLVAMGQSAQRLAVELGYEGAVTVGALEDEIRFYQRRSVEACLELGKRLLILKEMTPHGEFEQRAELLGFSKRMYQQFMSATMKFSNAQSNALLKSAGTQTKLLELLVLDDGEIAELESGESVRGITLDKIETMSVRELKKALRESNATLEASRSLAARKDQKINELEEQVGIKQVSVAEDLDGEELRQITSAVNYQVEVMLRGELKSQFQALAAHGEARGVNHANFMAGLVCPIEEAVNQLRGMFDIPQQPDSDEVPDWLRDEVQAG